MAQTNSPFGSMRFRLWRRHMSISSPRMTIRTQRPWPLRLGLVALVGFAGAFAMRGYETGRVLPLRHANMLNEQLADYKELAERLKAERDQFSATAIAAESQLAMGRATQRQLATQVRTLEQENIRLKEDLAFFESLLPNATGPQGIAIRRLKIDQIAPNQIRYRLLVMQGGKGERDFAGNLQLVVSALLQSGKNAMINFPDSNPTEQERFRLNFRHYQRIEGVLTLPEGATLKLIQARILERGQLRAQQSAYL